MNIPISQLVTLAVLLFAGMWANADNQSEELEGKRLTAVLSLAKTHFDGQEPIVVDVVVRNPTGQDLRVWQLHPENSNVKLPALIFVDKGNGAEFSLPPGLYTESYRDWQRWYQPAMVKGVSVLGPITIKAGTDLHLLHGDLREMIANAHAYCSNSLAWDLLHEIPNNVNTKKGYQSVIAFADRFSKGGTYRVRVHAYTVSNEIEITIDPGVETRIDSPEAKDAGRRWFVLVLIPVGLLCLAVAAFWYSKHSKQSIK